MNVYGVNISIQDLYYEVEALNQDDAIYEGLQLAYDELGRGEVPDLDCNECILLEGEEPDEDEDE